MMFLIFSTFKIKQMVQPHFEYFVQFQLSHLKNVMQVVDVQRKQHDQKDVMSSVQGRIQ